VLLGLGTYNGWYASMTTADVYNQGATYGCKSMQNLDYMTQLLNGWLQGKNGYELGSYFNRKEC
jgi:hypothetical protein